MKTKTTPNSTVGTQLPQVFIIDDDSSFRLCLEQIISRPCRSFSNAIEAMSALDETPPRLIFLDVLLDGPDAFTLLHELASYSDLSAIPVVLMTNLSLSARDFSTYGVVGLLNKATMTPSEVHHYVHEYCH